MKEKILIAIVGEDGDVEEILYKCFREFYPDRLLLLTKLKQHKKAEKIVKKLEKFDFKTQILELSKPSLEIIFSSVNNIKQQNSNSIVAINVDTDYMTSCLALSSAFVNGIQAVGVLGDKVIAYPIMQFSYYNALTDKKLEIIKAINEEEIISINELSKKNSITLPLLAYHLRGNKDSKGLEELNLVTLNKKNQITYISLTDLGRLIANGHITCEN